MIAKYMVLAIACLSHSTLAHKALEDEDDSYLMARENVSGLETSGLESKYERQVEKFPLLHKFSDEAKSRARGTLVVTRNAKTREIMEVDLEEDPAAIPEGQDLEDTFKAKCESGALYQLEVNQFDVFTSMTACYYYKSSGLNDTISF